MMLKRGTASSAPHQSGGGRGGGDTLRERDHGRQRLGRLTEQHPAHDAFGGPPVVEVTGTVAARAAEFGVTRFHVSISHDAGIASAVVVAERD